MDRLNKSLDQIMEEKQKENKKERKPQRSERKGSNHRKEKLSAGNKANRNIQFQKRRSLGSSAADDDDDDEPIDQLSQPIIIRTVERPKVVKSAVSAPSNNAQSSTVFNRLGQNGITVLFQNLVRSITEADVQELCRAVGDVKSVKLQSHANGTNLARAVFATQADADRCVTTYDARTLDGVPMRVTLENTQSQGIFGRLQSTVSAPQQQQQQQVARSVAAVKPSGENVRAGFFGTALADDNPRKQKTVMTFNKQQQAMDEDDDEEDEEVQGSGRKITFNTNNNNSNRSKGPPLPRGNKKLIRRNQQDGGGRSFKGRKVRGSGEGGGPVNLDDDLDQYMAQRG